MPQGLDGEAVEPREASNVSYSMVVFDRGSAFALVVSCSVHAAFLVLALVAATQHWLEPPWEEVAPAPVDPDLGGGDTFDIEGVVDGVEGKGGVTRPAVEPSEAPQPAAVVKTTAPAAEPAAPPPKEPPRRRKPRVRPPPAKSAEPVMAPPAASSSSSDERRAAAGDGPGLGGDKGGGERRSYGSEGSRRGVRNLARAFTRAIPPATGADDAWKTLPLGPVGRVDLTVDVDENGRVVAVEVDEKAPRVLDRLVTRTMALLRAGTYALTGVDGAGREKLRIDVVLSQREPLKAPEEGGDVALRFGHEPPEPGHPGRAYFTLVSGRHVEATIAIVSTVAASAQ
jgi:hypothetical protein